MHYAQWARHVLVIVLATAGLPAPAADPISASGVVAQREVRTPNRIGTVPGDHMRVGVLFVTPNPYDGQNGTVGTSVVAYPPGSPYPPVPYCDPVITRPPDPPSPCGETINFIFSHSSPDEFTNSRFLFSPAIAAPWRIVVANPESPNGPITFFTPGIFLADGFTIPEPMAFVHDMYVDDSLTFHWNAPATATFDAVSLRLWDRTILTPSGGATLIYSKGLPASARQYKPPVVLNSFGDTLQVGGQYTVGIQLIQNLPGGAVNRSASFFDFSPQPPGSPPVVYLPVVGPDNQYQFHVETVIPGQTIFVDPDPAVAYEYAIGAGDPGFASVLLPAVGDGIYGMQLFDGSRWIDGGVARSGVPYAFPAGGIARFRVTGIEASAGLDPANPSAFVTGLTFVGAGHFTGTMTPLTSEPDIAPPAISCKATPDLLWPPDGKLVDVTVNVVLTDTLSGPAGFSLSSIRSNEPEPGDMSGWTLGTDSVAGKLRAARSGAGGGRIYSLTYTGFDRAGNSASCTTTVTVPHDRGH